MKKVYVAFVIVCMLLLVFPFAGMLIDKPQTVSESGETIGVPKIHTEDGKINNKYLSEMGDYFNKNFAFRDKMVSVNAYLYGKIFNTSVTDQVLLGNEGWMYYTSTLNDYTSTHLMSERGLNNAVHNIKLIQNYVEASGSKFIFTIAPNKNSLYDDNMPYYYIKGESDNNYARFYDKISLAGINYVDLYEVFNENDKILYFKQDSHWNNEGAAVAYEAIMSDTDIKNYQTYFGMPYKLEQNHTGDLAKMIYPNYYELEEDICYEKEWQFSYVGEHNDNMDNWIETYCPNKNNTMLMYRDSFGEAIVPYFADEFEHAYFSRLVPYNLNNISQYSPDYVIIERVERRISSFAESPAVMDMPQTDIDVTMENVVFDDVEISDVLENEDGINTEIGNISIKESGDYYVIKGEILPELMSDTAEIYLGFKDGNNIIKYYDTFWISKEAENGINDYGYAVYFLKNSISSDVKEIRLVVK